MFLNCTQTQVLYNTGSNLDNINTNPLISPRKTLSGLGVFGMSLYFILILALCVFSLLFYVMIFTNRKRFKNIWKFLSFQEGLFFSLFTGYFLLLFGLITIIFTIISLILGIKNADTVNGASKWKCFLSYLIFGAVYKDHRINMIK